MDKGRFAWFAMGLLLGLGVILGAAMQDGKPVGRFQVLEANDRIGKNVIRLDTATGKTDVWHFSAEKCVWMPIDELKK